MRDSRRQLEEIASGFMPARILLSAVELGVFRTLGNEGLTAREIARRTSSRPEPIERLLDALVALAILRKRRGRYRNGPAAARHLIPGAREYLGDIMLHRASIWTGWSALTEVVRTGKVPARRGPRPDERERRFIKGMANLGGFSAPATVKALRPELRAVRRLLDVGGGPATYACAFARAKPDLEATVFDLPGPLRYARETIARERLERRVRVRPGDALADASYGAGYDMAFMSNFIHCFKRKAVPRIIGRAGAALGSGGILAVKDFFIAADRIAPRFAALFSINMLVADAGDCYSRGEVEEWFAAAGIEPVRFVEVPEFSGILIGRKR